MILKNHQQTTVLHKSILSQLALAVAPEAAPAPVPEEVLEPAPVVVETELLPALAASSLLLHARNRNKSVRRTSPISSQSPRDFCVVWVVHLIQP